LVSCVTAHCKNVENCSNVAQKRKVTLKEMQSLTGSLAFCTRALPPGKTFNRPVYGSFKNASKPHHYIANATGTISR
jgi:hypothetical protein